MRCGSYPFRYIAEDFGLPYEVVLNYADAIALSSQFDHKPTHLSVWHHQAVCYIRRNLAVHDRNRLYAEVHLHLQLIGAVP